MSKRKEITMESLSGRLGPLHLQWVGPVKPGKYAAGYIRFESEGQYRGSLTDGQAKRLMRWLNQYYGGSHA